jgi:hypothetical protein
VERYKAAVGTALIVTVLVAVSGCDSTASSSGSSTATSGPPSGGAGGAGGAGGQMQTFTAVDLNTDGDNASDANTTEVVTAATAFLATLDADTTSKVTYAFSDNQSRQTWSNYPAQQVPRKGVALTDLDASAKTAAMALVKTMLSAQGYSQVEAIQKADDWLNKNSADGNDAFGSDTDYYIAVYGTPSTTTPFQVQFGGHHLARNYTYDASTVSITPDFTGTEPKSFAADGATIEPLKEKAGTMLAVFNSLTAEQKSKAELSGGTVDDILMGPGVDSGKFPTSEGVLVGDLSAAQKKLVTAAIQAWVGDAAVGPARSLMAAYLANLDTTRVSWAGSTTVDGEDTYLRIDGPRVWIELINTRSRSTPNVHYHGVYRDKNDDYGSSNPSTT